MGSWVPLGEGRRIVIRSIDGRNLSGYIVYVIISFDHKGLEKYFYDGNKRGIQPAHAQKIADILARISHTPRALARVQGRGHAKDKNDRGPEFLTPIESMWTGQMMRIMS